MANHNWDAMGLRMPERSNFKTADFDMATDWVKQHVLDNYEHIITRIEYEKGEWLFFDGDGRLLVRLEHTVVAELQDKLERLPRA